MIDYVTGCGWRSPTPASASSLSRGCSCSLSSPCSARTSVSPRRCWSAGGLGLAFALLVPGNAARVGYRFARLPKRLSPGERRLIQETIRRRRPWLMVLACLPYLVAVADYWIQTRDGAGATSVGNLVTAGFFSTVFATSLAWGVQYVQVWWTLRRDERSARADVGDVGDVGDDTRR